MKRWLDAILDEANVEKAMYHTVQKNTCAGVDKVTARQLQISWAYESEAIINAICRGTYYPLPARRVFIDKENGKKRKLTIPAMQDRMLQRCIVNVLGECFERYFHENSFGFRKGRGTKEAIEQVILYMNEGWNYVIDLDIKDFFDTINHAILLELLKRTIDDKQLLVLIKRYLKIYIFCGRKIIQTHRGVAQGGPISSLLGNIVLNELDWYLNDMGWRFVRYADDVVIFCKTIDEAQQILDKVKLFLYKQLHLDINAEKTKILKSEDLEYLGMAFKKEEYDYKLVLNDRIKERMREKLHKCFRQKRKSEMRFWDALGGFHRGWLNYYQKLDEEELRNHLYMVQQYENTAMKEYMKKAPKTVQKQKIALLQSKQYISFDKWLEVIISRNI